MEIVQRERRIICGLRKDTAAYQEVELYGVSKDPTGKRRDREMTDCPSFKGKEKWDRHNAAKARRWFNRVAITNFTEKDLHTTLTYANGLLPKTIEEANRDITNFLRKLRKRCEKRGLERPEAIIVTEYSDTVRYHHHVLLKCDLSRDEIEACWTRKGERLGRANCDRLQMDKGSLEALCNYLLKYTNRKHRWRRTKGIKDPIVPKPNDSRWTRRTIERIATDGRLHSPDFWGKKYPGWVMDEAEAEYNEFWGWNIRLKMHREPGRGKGAKIRT